MSTDLPDNLPPLPPNTRYAGRLRDHSGRLAAFIYSATDPDGWEYSSGWVGMDYDPQADTADWHVALPIEAVRDEPATGVEAKVCADIAARQRVGIAKYGCTVAESKDDMLRHAYEEALDLAVYLKAEIERRQTLLDQGLQDNRPPS
jgi:hypothetical protein